MQQIILFFVRKKNFFVFLLLFCFSISLIFNSNYYHQSKYINSANAISGSIFSLTNHWSQYFHLRTQNDLLNQENRLLRSQLLSLEEKYRQIALIDSVTYYDSGKYKVYTANVIKNSFMLNKNYLTIDKGKLHGISEDMGVISPNGIVGIIENTGSRFSTVQSVLNTKSSLNAMVKKTGHFGSLKWDGKCLNIVQLIDIPNIAPIQKGDTIITGGMSNIFPKGVPIGKITDFAKSPINNTYLIDIELFNDMSNIDHIYIIQNTTKQEITNLENQLSNE